jgi:hypothetical protein
MVESNKSTEDMRYIIPQLTSVAQSQQKYQRFKQWLVDNGAVFDLVDFPCIYGKGLMGIGANEDIG